MCFASSLGWRGMAFGRDLFFSPNLKTEMDPGIYPLANRKRKRLKSLPKTPKCGVVAGVGAVICEGLERVV